MIRVSLETTDPSLAKDAVRAFARRGFRRCRGKSELAPNRWRCSKAKVDGLEKWSFEWIDEEKDSRSALTLDDIRRIRTLRRRGATVAELASEFRVHAGTIKKILRGQRRAEP